jgi:hypothetical protein
MTPVQTVDKTTGRPKSVVREYAESIIIAVVLALVIRTFVVQAFKIPSGSMEDTLLIGDHILVNKLSYGLQLPLVDTQIRLPGHRADRAPQEHAEQPQHGEPDEFDREARVRHDQEHHLRQPGEERRICAGAVAEPPSIEEAQLLFHVGVRRPVVKEGAQQPQCRDDEAEQNEKAARHGDPTVDAQAQGRR